jgi:hypothetical protein
MLELALAQRGGQYLSAILIMDGLPVQDRCLIVAHAEHRCGTQLGPDHQPSANLDRVEQVVCLGRRLVHQLSGQVGRAEVEVDEQPLHRCTNSRDVV